MSASGFAVADDMTTRRLPDIRLLVDVSDSLLLEGEEQELQQWLGRFLQLLPVGARFGVWRFADTVEVSMPHGASSAEDGRIDALVNTQPMSDLPAALSAASTDLVAPDPLFETMVIVLTDSGVNVSASPISNAQAARRLLAELAPALRNKGVAVYTIALGDDADGFLLRALAHATQGLDYQAASIDALPQILLRLLDRIDPSGVVVTTEKGFVLGKPDRQLRLLLAHPAGQEVSLLDPSGLTVSKDLVSPDVTWHAGKWVDVVTMAAPASGNWRWQGVDVQDSVIRVSAGVGIRSGKLSPVVLAGSQLRWQLELSGLAAVEVQDGLTLVVEVTNPQEEQQILPVLPATDGLNTSAAGFYSVVLPVFDLPGRYRVLARLDVGDIARQSVTWVEVLPAGLNHSITTRSQYAAEQSFQRPVFSLAVFGFIAVLILIWVLRQRRQRKLELWQRRFHDPD
jgi:hypothetical protein